MGVLNYTSKKSRTFSRLEQIAEASLRQFKRPRTLVGIQSRHGTIRFEDGKVIFDEDQPNES